MTKSTLYALTGVSQCQSLIVVTTRIIDDSITIHPLHARSPSFIRSFASLTCAHSCFQ